MTKFLNSLLCLFLSPLLSAQQVAQPAAQQAPGMPTAGNTASPNPPSGFVTLTEATEIKLVSLEPISSATANPGMKIHLRVNEDVAVENMTVIPAGTILTATVEKVTRASKKHHRDGQIRLRIDNFKLASGQNVRLTGVSPSERFKRKQERESAAKDLLWLPLAAPILPIIALLAIAFWVDGDSIGNDVGLDQCAGLVAYTRNPVKVRLADLPAKATASSAASPSGCPSGCNYLNFRAFYIDVE